MAMYANMPNPNVTGKKADPRTASNGCVENILHRKAPSIVPRRTNATDLSTGFAEIFRAIPIKAQNAIGQNMKKKLITMVL
ncbi:hypothetical protein NBRC116590_27730 [Pelagimonas sp. KU-00592-HH]